MVEGISGVSRSLAREEKVAILKCQVEFLDDSIAEMQERIALLVDDNAEMDFLSTIDGHYRARAERETHYEANASKIRELEGEISTARESQRLYKEVLEKQFGIDLQ